MTDLRPLARIFALVLGLTLCSALVFADGGERITRYDSDIRIQADGSLLVTETITAICLGQEIKRGIYRDFPTTYEGRSGQRVVVGFDIVKVERDGASEPYHTERQRNGLRVYVGQKNVFLTPGEHIFAITYTTTRQLGFFTEFDELYWNVTGNGWNFPIDQAQAKIHLPAGAAALRTSAYTGPAGAQGQDWVASGEGSEVASFETTRMLAPYEGLTIAVSWPKGFVPEPSSAEKAKGAMAANWPEIAGFLGLLILFAYYIFTWVAVGVDPPKGPVIPLFTPPKGFSPAAVRFVSRMSYDQKAFVAAVVNMAVKGYLKIIEKDAGFFARKTYTLERTGQSETALSRAEKAAAGVLFGGSRSSIELKNTNHSRISSAISAHKDHLKDEFGKIHFSRNTGFLIPGLAVSFLSLVAMVVGPSSGRLDPGVLIFALVAALFALIPVWMLYRLWKTFQTASNMVRAILVIMGLPALWFLITSVVPALPFLGFLMIADVLLAVILGGHVVMHILFYHLLKAPSVMGRKAMDAIEGFQLYLTVAEKERLGLLYPPEKTPELFEKYFPYALALDVEEKWSSQFTDVLAAAAATAGTAGAYHPSWYHGGSFSPSNLSSWGSDFGSSFSQAISSSATAPGSSSGSGGGGSSGGGGGGGGGGGW